MEALDQLADAARGGDRAASQRFVELAYDPVWCFCAGLVDVQSADDLAQEVCLKAMAGIDSFRGGSSASTWILSVARNTCMDELRARTRRRLGEASIALALRAAPRASDPSVLSAINDLIRRLEPERRAAFVLTQLIGLSYDEAAAVCSCPVGTIRSRISRGRAELVSWLAEDAALGTDRDRPTSPHGQLSGRGSGVGGRAGSTPQVHRCVATPRLHP